LAIVAIALGFLFPVAIAEIVLRFLPVVDGAYTTAVNSAHPLLHFEPNHTFTYSVGPRLEYANTGKINNVGWVNDQTYDSTATTPLLAIVGDSYVEAFIVPYRESLQGRLAAAAGGSRRVYSFGMSGWPLSQYLAASEVIAGGYRPAALIVNVVANDFDESLLRYKNARGFHFFREIGADSLALQRIDYTPRWYYASWPHRRAYVWIVRHSALWRYAGAQLNLVGKVRDLFSPPSGSRVAKSENDYVGNVPRVVEPERMALSKRAVDEFLRELPRRSGLSPRCIAFIVDGMRPQLYDARQLEQAATSYFGEMRRYFMDNARAGGFEVIDMQPIFVAHYAATRQRVEFPHDGHWNSTGHRLAADAVAKSRVFMEFTRRTLTLGNR